MRGEATSVRREAKGARCVALLSLLALLLPAVVLAQETSWGIDALMQQLSQVKQKRARFVERKYLRVLSRPLELTGTLAYEAPGRVEKITETPRPERLLIDADRLTIEGRSARRQRSFTLQEYPVLWGFVESFRATLNGDLAALQRFYRVELSGDADAWQLVLTPQERKMAAVISAIRISGRDGRVHTVEVDEAQGDRSVMTVTEDPG